MSIELQTGTECLISDSSDAELYAAFEGDGNYILRKPLDLTMSSTNTLIIGPGTGLQNGRHIRFKGTTEVTIPSGVQAEKRSNIVVVRTTISRDEDTMETLTHSEAMVLTGKSTMDGEPTDPEWIEGNLLDGDTIADFPIARVVTDGINVREPEPLYNVLASAADFRDSQYQPTEIGKTSSTTYRDIGSVGNHAYYILQCMYSSSPRVLATTVIPRANMIGVSSSDHAHSCSLGYDDFTVSCYCKDGRIYARAERDTYCTASILGIM